MKKTFPQNSGKRLMFIFLCMYSIGIFAQNITVTGLVADTQGEPLIGVTIQVVGTVHGTVTDIDGRYTLSNTPSDAILVFSYVGTQSQTVNVNGRTTINITLLEDSEMLEDVVVVAYGVQKKGYVHFFVHVFDRNICSKHHCYRASC